MRHPGIKVKLALSFAAIVIIPVVVTFLTLGLVLSFDASAPFSQTDGLVSKERAARIVAAPNMPEDPEIADRVKMILGERVPEIEPMTEKMALLLLRGETDTALAAAKQIVPYLVEIQGILEIIGQSGTTIMILSPKGVVMGGGLNEKDLLDRKALANLSPGIEFIGGDEARYVWMLGEGGGYARLRFSLGLSFEEVRVESQRYVFLALAAGILSFVFLVFLLSGNLSRDVLVPLRGLTSATEHIAAGNLDFELDYKKNDEFGRLCAAFELMRRKLKESLVRIQKNDGDRKQMIASVSHDLRTPLTSIRGYVEGLRDGVADNKKARERYLSVILDKTEKLEYLIDNLFRISRLDLDDAGLEFKSVSAAAMFGEIFDRAARDLENAGFVFNAGNAVPEVLLKADPQSIAQVVDNIVQNAKRYINAGGTVRVASAEREGFLDVSISDNGPGISKTDLPRIFDLFYRGDKARSGHDGAAGIGLAMCKRVMELHGGSISAKNGEEGGAVFTLSLPVERKTGKDRSGRDI